jgi:hypothetical protein
MLRDDMEAQQLRKGRLAPRREKVKYEPLREGRERFVGGREDGDGGRAFEFWAFLFTRAALDILPIDGFLEINFLDRRGLNMIYICMSSMNIMTLLGGLNGTYEDRQMLRCEVRDVEDGWRRAEGVVDDVNDTICRLIVGLDHASVLVKLERRRDEGLLNLDSAVLTIE